MKERKRLPIFQERRFGLPREADPPPAEPVRSSRVVYETEVNWVEKVIVAVVRLEAACAAFADSMLGRWLLDLRRARKSRKSRKSR